jgi:hypothetical protein
LGAKTNGYCHRWFYPWPHSAWTISKRLILLRCNAFGLQAKSIGTQGFQAVAEMGWYTRVLGHGPKPLVLKGFDDSGGPETLTKNQLRTLLRITEKIAGILEKNNLKKVFST